MKVDLHITTQPKCFIWIDREPAISDFLRVELLKHDILLKKDYSSNIETLLKKHNERKGYLFSLDGFIQLTEAKRQPDVFAKANDYLMIIQNFVKNRSIVYTSYIDTKIEALFKSNNIPIIMKNLNDEKHALQLLKKISIPFFEKSDSRMNRGFLRLILKDAGIKADLYIQEKYKIECTLKDISMGGVGFYIKAQELERFSIKGLIHMKIYIPRHVIRIKAAVVIRIDEETKEVGCQFNIDDERMVDPAEGKTLSNFLLTQIHELSKELKFSECD